MNSPPPSPSSAIQKPTHSTLLLTTLESTLSTSLTHAATLEHITHQLHSLRETLQSLGGLHLLAQTTRNKYLETLRRNAGLSYSRIITNMGGLDQEFFGRRSVGGDAVADALLYRDAVRDDSDFFVQVYGVSWGRVLGFRHDTELIQAISHRADVFARGQGFTAEFNVMFEQLIAWGVKHVGSSPSGGARGGVLEDNQALSWFTHVMSS